MKITETKGRIIISALGLCAICALSGGAILLGFFERIVRYIMKKQLILKPGYEFFDIWKDLPIPIYQKLYLFNITNPEEFSNNGSKPILQEIGPYVFKGRWMKELMDWDDKQGTVTYKDFKDYTFVPELSVGDQEEKIYTLNAPLLAIINYAEDYSPYFLRNLIADMMDGVFESYNETLIVHKTVRELVYEGYHVPMVGDLLNVVEPFLNIPLKLINNTFGILHEKKHIGDGVFTVKSGVNGIEDYASIFRWNNKTSVDWWKGEECNRIIGTDGVQYAPGVTMNTTLSLFNPNLCRSLPLKYEKDITVHGIKTLRFGIPSTAFATGDENPDNKCYCSGRDCHSGILPLNCKKGAPYVISQPHFLEGEPELRDNVIGINPSAEKHKTYVDVEPTTGFVLNAAFRVQLNGVTRNLPHYKALQSVAENIVPVLWMSEEAQLDTYFANYFKSRVQTRLIMFKAACMFAIVFGAIWTIGSLAFLFCIQAKVKPDIKSALVLKTLNSVYTGVALWPPEEDVKESQISEKTPL